MGDHLQHFYEPRLQRHVLRILWMPVVFGVDNWVALRWTTAGWGAAGTYMGVLTGWYEAWVLQSFYNYLEAFLEGEHGEPGSLARLPVVTETPEHRLLFPFCWCKPWRMTDGQFIFRSKLLVLQYTLVQTICTFVTFVTQLTGDYHDGDSSSKYAYVWVTALINISQVVALYALVGFYRTMHEALLPMRPLGKFLCVKLVIFFSFWQEMICYAAVKYGLIKHQTSWAAITADQAGAGVQEFLMCVEMAVAAIAHFYVFPIEDYKKGHSKLERAARPGLAESTRMMFSVKDVLADIAIVFGIGAGRAEGAADEGSSGHGRGVEMAGKGALGEDLSTRSHALFLQAQAAPLLDESGRSTAAAWARQAPPPPPRTATPPPQQRKGSLADDMAAIAHLSNQPPQQQQSWERRGPHPPPPPPPPASVWDPPPAF